MSCAGCDDCPEGRWHLHVTVAPPELLTAGVFSYELDMKQIGARPVRVRNLVTDGEDYDELIPTRHFSGALEKAQHEIVLLSCELFKLGYVATRVKIEGDPELSRNARVPARYWESHVSVANTSESLRVLLATRVERSGSLGGRHWPALSTSGSRLIATVRHPSEHAVRAMTERLEHELFGRVPILKKRTEVCVMDTAPELDDRWLGR